MAKLLKDSTRYFRRALGPRGRVLLVNPPVQERRYNWIRWNQPLELLLLSAWMKKEYPRTDVRLFDFMLPDPGGNVEKRTVKETWTGNNDIKLWHFGRPFDAFERYIGDLLERERWVPHCIVVSSLTSYWHVSIEKLLIRLCNRLRRKYRQRIEIVLYGNYPRFEPEHAQTQPDADIALQRPVRSAGLQPDFALYLEAESRLPNFFALDITDVRVAEHIEGALDLFHAQNKRPGSAKLPTPVFAFFNDDLCGRDSRLQDVARVCDASSLKPAMAGIAGLKPDSLDSSSLELLKAAGFRSLYVEHARRKGGATDLEAYQPLVEMLRSEERTQPTRHQGSSGGRTHGVTAFVEIGRPGDNMDELVRSTLQLNSAFGSVILKPFGYSPSIDDAPAELRRSRWSLPRESSPQWYPYSRNGSALSQEDYANLIRWQNVLNKRVKGQTFDFLGSGTVSRLVRETLVMESWKPERAPA